jgi:FixJ family two-component response regulator
MMALKNKSKVLYIEDDMALARLMQKRLNRAGYVVELAPDAGTGLARLEKQGFDVLLLDQRLPGLSGLELLEKLAYRDLLPPAVMVTGAGDEKTAVKAMKIGASDYIVKDPDGGYLELLPAVLERVLKQKQLADAKKEAEAALQRAHDHLEQQVAQRTAELMEVNQSLKNEISERKKAEKQLQEAHEGLEKLVKQRTRELVDKTKGLEELNIALKVLLQQREKDKEALEENIIENVTNLILPCVDRLKNFNLSPDQKAYLQILEKHIKEIISPFAYKLSSKYFNLTPTEIRVAVLIKQDKTTKDIAELFNISQSAIIFHRHNIRKKLGLQNKKANLRTFLHGLE